MTRQIEALIAECETQVAYWDKVDAPEQVDFFGNLAAALRSLLEEVERLTALVADREASIKDCHAIAKDAEIRAFGLLEEVERLGEALRKIAWLRPAGPSRGGLVEQMERIALAALETTHD